MNRRTYLRNSTVTGMASVLGITPEDIRPWSDGQQDSHRHVYNVREPEFGARENGEVDDTDSIQRAINAAAPIASNFSGAATATATSSNSMATIPTSCSVISEIQAEERKTGFWSRGIRISCWATMCSTAARASASPAETVTGSSAIGARKTAITALRSTATRTTSFPTSAGTTAPRRGGTGRRRRESTF